MKLILIFGYLGITDGKGRNFCITHTNTEVK